MKFLVVTNAPLLKAENKFSAYAPYVKEMDIWFRNVDEVGIIAPKSYPQKIFSKDFQNQNIKFFSIPFFQLKGILNFLKSIFILPLIFFKGFRAFLWADHIHLRCPGNIGLIGSVIQIFFPNKPKTVKYAGNWDPHSKQPWSYKLQKWILNNTFLSRNIKVLVYGNWPKQSKNIIRFFTASFSKDAIVESDKDFRKPYKFIFVGSLTAGKRPLFAIRLMEILMRNNIPVTLELYGDGILREEILEYIQVNNLEPFVKMMGNKDLNELIEAYKSAHFLILASISEGWPKAIAEAMFYGCIPISTAVSCIPWMLDEGERGILIDADLESASRKIMNALEDKANLGVMSQRAQEWSASYTLERFESEIQKFL
ncbi:glycosyltransferase family 4 protein [Gillisia sp. M10.2A]|uniref:Glycosyltransferase family 4 protein n=1 Tax=Gillisia lutea TaxID=2909668 RepID=A0ABS9EL03_9FLAO|nr:glycosyltransferase [Gillisia lutea]MCF4102136.1 glycosyltransferase family 4 protein [Gillisia lutea]